MVKLDEEELCKMNKQLFARYTDTGLYMILSWQRAKVGHGRRKQNDCFHDKLNRLLRRFRVII